MNFYGCFRFIISFFFLLFSIFFLRQNREEEESNSRSLLCGENYLIAFLRSLLCIFWHTKLRKDEEECLQVKDAELVIFDRASKWYSNFLQTIFCKNIELKDYAEVLQPPFFFESFT